MPHIHIPNSVFIFHVYGLQPEKFAHCNVAVVQRLASRENLEALKLFKRMKMKIIYDLDDDMWQVPSYNPAFKVMKAWLPGFSICAMQADLITVSTAHLKVTVNRELGKDAPPITVIENAIDFEWFQPLKPEYRRDKKGRVVMGWAGTNTHSKDTQRVFDKIPYLLKKLPMLDFELAGIKMPPEWEKFGDRIRQRDFIPVAEFASNWASWQWDLSIAPVEDNPFNLSKSNIKGLEAATMHIPCVMSNVGEYKKLASYSKILKDTLISKGEMDWERKITELVVNEEYRKLVGEELYRVAKEHYDVRKRVEKWQQAFEQVL